MSDHEDRPVPVDPRTMDLQGSFSGDQEMCTDDAPSGLDWIPLGEHACGLVFGGRIVALVYWQHAQPGGADEHSGAGFWWVPADLPVDHFSLFAASNPSATEWARAREDAANAYADWAPREAAYTEELRHEAAELLSRARQDGRLHETPLRTQARSP